MRNILDIRVQKLFVVILILKVLSSGVGWHFGYPWSFGFWIPLAFMGVYIVLGLKRNDKDVTDEKFADTCYYLGFIFTITSIIFSLLDLPNIGTKIQEIAVRFGAAMVSTVLGLSVRVYLVSFKKDVADAVKDAEDAVLDATRKFTEQLTIALERLRNFEAQVDTAAKSSVERVNLQVESLSKNHADKLSVFFSDLTTRNQEVFTEALKEVKSASLRLADSVDGYSQGMRANLKSIETKVQSFTDAVSERLKTTSFPDDYFAQHLAAPLNQLKSAAEEISGGVHKASKMVGESSVVLSGALKKLRDKSNVAEGSLDKILKLTEQQHAVLETAEGQLTALEQLSSTLSGFDALFAKTLEGISAGSTVNSELATRVKAVVVEGADARKMLDRSLADVVAKLSANAVATESLASQVGASTNASKHVVLQLAENAAKTEALAGKLAANSAASALVASKLDGIAAADIEAAITLSSLGRNASTAIEKVDGAVEQLHAMVSRLTSLDGGLRIQSGELKEIAAQINSPRHAAPAAGITPPSLPSLMSSGISHSASPPAPHSPASDNIAFLVEPAAPMVERALTGDGGSFSLPLTIAAAPTPAQLQKPVQTLAPAFPAPPPSST